MRLDRGLGQGGPADGSAVDQADHVRADPGQPLGGLAETDRRAHQGGLVRAQRLEHQQVGAGGHVDVRRAEVVADHQGRLPAGARAGVRAHRSDVHDDQQGVQRRARGDLHRAAGRDDGDRLTRNRGASGERLPGLGPGGLHHHPGAEGHRTQGQHLCASDATDQHRPGLLGPEQPGDHRLAGPVVPEHQAGRADAELQAVDDLDREQLARCPAGHVQGGAAAQRKGGVETVQVFAVQAPRVGPLRGEELVQCLTGIAEGDRVGRGQPDGDINGYQRRPAGDSGLSVLGGRAVSGALAAPGALPSCRV
jgi:hypothetical protein